MVGLMVHDMAASLEFYRRLGLDIPEGSDAKEFVEVRMESGVTISFDTVFADMYDPDRKRPSGGYQMMPEFFHSARVEIPRAEQPGRPLINSGCRR